MCVLLLGDLRHSDILFDSLETSYFKFVAGIKSKGTERGNLSERGEKKIQCDPNYISLTLSPLSQISLSFLA